MKNNEGASNALWPIIEAREDWPQGAWIILNVGALLAVSTPFLMALGLLSFGLWIANEIQSLLLEWLATSPRMVTNGTYGVKLCMVAFTANILWRMMPFIPALVDSARAVVRDET